MEVISRPRRSWTGWLGKGFGWFGRGCLRSSWRARPANRFGQL